jgi:hypothetical protein
MARPWIRRIGRIAIAVVVAMALLWAIGWLWSLLAPPSDSRTITAIVIVAIVLLAVIWWLWWRLPKRQVHGLNIQIHDPKARADTEDNFRKTVGQALGGAAVLIGAVAAYLQFTQQQQATRDQLQASHDLLISNQVSKGFEQLAGKEIAMRLGGIYALEGVMNTSPEYYQPVLEALCAFVRDSTPHRQVVPTRLFSAQPSFPAETTTDRPPNDILAALTVIRRRKAGPGVVDLTGATISSAKLTGARLSRADLSSADLRRADLSHADLSDADLTGADLSLASLTNANLAGARLGRADLTGADLSHANLTGARLSDADLSHADLRRADLSHADLSDAYLDGADLSDAYLSDADLSSGPYLTQPQPKSELWQSQLDLACGKPKALPPGLTLDKPCPQRPATPNSATTP